MTVEMSIFHSVDYQTVTSMKYNALIISDLVIY
jgi:hypothetical protein